MRVLIVFGTRPEAIKLAPVIYEFKRRAEFEVRVCVTGQHRQMLYQVLDFFGIVPDYDLRLMEFDQSLFRITARALEGLETTFRQEAPDIVLVQGDTTTTIAAALAAYYLKLPLGHIEAGLRTGDRYNPFPEEMNRRLTDVLADWCFAPTERARQNLLREGIPSKRIVVTGNTIVDALHIVLRQQALPMEQRMLEESFRRRCHVNLNDSQRILLVTGHRRESFGPELEGICLALKTLADRNPDVCIIYPVHLNPNIQEPVRRILGGAHRVHLIEPLEYLLFIWLMSRSYLVLTDSGGVQEEAPTFGKPILVLRKQTERPEGIHAGVAQLVGTHPETIVRETEGILNDERRYLRMAKAVNPYGDGLASARIAGILQECDGLKKA